MQLVRRSGGAQVNIHHARLHHCAPGHWVDLQHLVEPGKRHDYPARRWHRTARKPRACATRYHRPTRCRCNIDNPHDFGSAGRHHHNFGRCQIERASIVLVEHQLFVAVQHVACANGGL